MDREKVILGLEICTANPPTCRGCPYYDSCKIDAQKLKEDALALLKEQEAREQCLKTKCVICPHCDNCDVDENGLLKEQEYEEWKLDKKSSWNQIEEDFHWMADEEEALCEDLPF